MKTERYILFRNADVSMDADEYLQILCRIIDSIMDGEPIVGNDEIVA